MPLLITSTSLIFALCLLDIKPLMLLIKELKMQYRREDSLFHKVVNKVWIYLKPFLNWRFLVSYSVPFMLINGWAWIGVFLFPYYKNWFTIASVSWMTFLWMPFTPEKLVTIPMAIWIHTLIFKHEKRTRAMLDQMYAEARADWEKVKRKLFKNKNKKPQNEVKQSIPNDNQVSQKT